MPCRSVVWCGVVWFILPHTACQSNSYLSNFSIPVSHQCDENDVATEHEISSSATATPYRFGTLTLRRCNCEFHTLSTHEILLYSPALFRLLLYDKHAGGLGVCDELYCKRSQLLQSALELLTSCPCGAASCAETHGCPSCLLDQRYLHYLVNIASCRCLCPILQ